MVMRKLLNFQKLLLQIMELLFNIPLHRPQMDDTYFKSGLCEFPESMITMDLDLPYLDHHLLQQLLIFSFHELLGFFCPIIRWQESFYLLYPRLRLIKKHLHYSLYFNIRKIN